MVYKEHSLFEKPREKARIWRYMDFTKFVSLLENNALFFPRADTLGDPFEGSFSKANIPIRNEIYVGGDEGLTPEDVSEIYRLLPEFTAISCWHINWYESAAMWKVYLKSNEGIAIRSNFEKLKNSLKDKKNDIYIGKVKYIDYKKEAVPEGPLECFVRKRTSFKFEAELRAVIQKLPRGRSLSRAKRPFNDGFYVPVDLDTINKSYLYCAH
ncbi:hypothetical protein ACFLUY_03065 [Chloroflexota bacterium]